MRKALLFCVFIFAYSMDAYSQTQQGNFLLGGGFGATFGSRKIEVPVSGNTVTVTEEKSTRVIFNPKVGFFIVDGFALGLDAEINNTTYKNKKNNPTSFTLGPFARYYFPVNVFLEGKTGFGNSKNIEGIGEARVFGYSFGAGYAAFLNDYISIEPMLRFRGNNYTNVNNEKHKVKNAGLEILIGLQIYL